MRVALLGTGLMGAPMARNIAAADYPLTVWNRTKSKALDLGASISDTPQEAVAEADIVITMLTDGTAVLDLLLEQGVAAAMKKGATLIDMSSIKPTEGRALGEALDALNISYLDAPVSGGTKGAVEGNLAIMVGGEAAVLEAAQPVMKTMGRAVLVGPRSAGYLAKLANQAIVAATIGAVSEAVLLLERGGADIAAVRDALKGGFADSTILQLHGNRMATREFTPGGHSWVQLKDLRNIGEEAGALGLNLPLLESVTERFDHLVTDMGHAELDHSALFLELLSRNPES